MPCMEAVSVTAARFSDLGDERQFVGFPCGQSTVACLDYWVRTPFFNPHRGTRPGAGSPPWWLAVLDHEIANAKQLTMGCWHVASSKVSLSGLVSLAGSDGRACQYVNES